MASALVEEVVTMMSRADLVVEAVALAEEAVDLVVATVGEVVGSAVVTEEAAVVDLEATEGLVVEIEEEVVDEAADLEVVIETAEEAVDLGVIEDLEEGTDQTHLSVEYILVH